jgi:hypothetical protein
MIARVCVAATALLAFGCGSSSTESQTTIDRCVDRLLSRDPPAPADEAAARSYVERTYCRRFAENGWIDDDGVVRIAAQHWLDRSRTCATGGEGEPARTVMCEELRRTDPILDCALLHHVRRSEVRTYLAQLDRTGRVRCDDGTPLAEVGVP